LEATTGWRFVAEELARAGYMAHLAEPADTRALRGPKRRAKTDRTDAHHLRELLRAGMLPEFWMPPAHIADARTQVRLRRALVGERTGWYQRIHAILFHHGLPDRSWLLTADGRAWLARAELPAVARPAVDLALRMLDCIDTELDLLDTTLAHIARTQPGCKALMGRYGIGWLTEVAICAEFGDVLRFATSRQAVRFTGLDITITESDGKRARGHLARQGLVHRARNTLAKVSAHDQAQVKANFWAIFDVGDAAPGDQAVAVAHRQAAEFAAQWKCRYPPRSSVSPTTSPRSRCTCGSRAEHWAGFVTRTSSSAPSAKPVGA
jgi:transposase